MDGINGYLALLCFLSLGLMLFCLRQWGKWRAIAATADFRARQRLSEYSPLEPEVLGRQVRQTWVRWAMRQPSPKPSWTVEWDKLGDDQREVDMLIGRDIETLVVNRIRAKLAETSTGATASRMLARSDR